LSCDEDIFVILDEREHLVAPSARLAPAVEGFDSMSRSS
jgi:hypothetical protein